MGEGSSSSTFASSLTRRGLDELLAHFPQLELVHAHWQVDGPWLIVHLGQQSVDGSDRFAIHPYAIWKRTGAVHGVEGGAVTDDPLWPPPA